MAKKKKVKVKKKIKKSKKTVKRAKGKSKRFARSKNKISIAFKKLILFTILFIGSYLIYDASSNALWSVVAQVVAIITGLIALAFLIAWLVLVFLKLMKK